MRLSTAETLSLAAAAGRNALGLLGRRTHPPVILWVVTQRCFYRCTHCESWRDETPIRPGVLLEIAETIARSEAALVALSGGEPFMVKNLRALVATLKAAGKVVSINTNGHLLAEQADWVLAAGVDHLQISVDGDTAALHDGIRREPGSFARILRGIERIRGARAGGRPRVAVCGVVMPENVDRLAAFVERFAGIADEVELQPLHDSPGLLAPSATAPFVPADRPRVERQLAAVAAAHAAFDHAYHRGIARFLFEPDTIEPVATDHCLPRIFNTLTIREDGGCYICRYPLGTSILSREVAEVWNAPARWDLYRRLVAEGCAAPCWLRCYSHRSPLPGRMLKRVIAAGTDPGPR